MIHKIFSRRILSVALSASTLLASNVIAQTAAPTGPPAASQEPFKSAFEGYQAYSDDKMTNWKAANDEVARIGGWREYAKQAQQPENTPAARASDAKPKATP